MPVLLHIETATDTCSIGISKDGEMKALQEKHQTGDHAAIITSLIESCCQIAQIPMHLIDAIAVSQGPGAYTSLRVGVSVAKGIAYALNKPLIAIDTLEALAIGARKQMNMINGAIFVPMLDARRDEVWLSAYDENLRRLFPPQPLILSENLIQNVLQMCSPYPVFDRLYFLGTGAKKISNGLFNPENGSIIELECSAAFFIPVAEKKFEEKSFVSAAYFEPIYMKPPHITQSNKKI